MEFSENPDLTQKTELLAQKILDEGQVEKMVACHLSEQNWSEVFLVVAGLVDSGDKLLELMETAAQKYINTDKLLTLLHWADRATAGSLANFKPVTKRVAALALALDLACSRVLDLDCDPDLIRARTLTHELAFSRGIVGILVSTRSGEREFTLARDLALTLTRTRARDLLLVRNLVHDIAIADKFATAKIGTGYLRWDS